ncbi:hypothetical protein PPROV_000469100 [Pycnococcus provasolii]|uniref:J domain-containing protein n=1 Tax=Pycnococcus provasolii TaxID=41880 RepID=A0A830HFS5_9CHLO|nr:hypothetical protein PPROV_000469100 [Pycnococcus provasolii]
MSHPGSFHSFEPVQSELESARIWRQNKLKQFRFRMTVLRVQDEPTFVEAYNEMVNEHNLVERLAVLELVDDGLGGAKVQKGNTQAHHKQTRGGNAAPPTKIVARPSVCSGAPERCGPAWWVGSTYDDEKAEKANDEANSAFAAKQYELAFDKYTEAIRKNPKSHAFHANRAAAALKLARYECAVEDASNAIARCQEHTGARVRLARALLGIGRVKASVDCAQELLQMSEAGDLPALTEAQRKSTDAVLRDAERESTRLARDAEAARLRAERGERAPLPPLPLPPDDAASLLLSAREVLAALCKGGAATADGGGGTSLEGARCAEVEALVHCRRYDDARRALPSLREGLDKAYLTAEVMWRSGDLRESARLLARQIAPRCDVETMSSSTSSASSLPSPSDDEAEAEALLDDTLPIELPDTHKCVALMRKVCELRRLVSRGDRQREREQFRDALESYADALAYDSSVAATRLAADLHHKRATCLHVGLLRTDDALAELEKCTALEPSHLGGGMLRASIYQDQGKHQACLLELYRVRNSAPDATDGSGNLSALWEELCAAARRCLNEEAGAKDYHEQVKDASRARGELSLYALLEVDAGVSVKELKKAYRRLAAKWHPDKWVKGTETEKSEAEAKFKAIKDAYEMLLGTKK